MKPRKVYQYRPLTHWPYYRRPGDFRSHLDDLYFWGFIGVRPFFCIFSDPWDGMLNVEHKNRLNEAHARMRGGRRMSMFGGWRHKCRARVPDNMQLIRYRSAENRPKEPVKGLWGLLSAEQKAQALDHDGPDVLC